MQPRNILPAQLPLKDNLLTCVCSEFNPKHGSAPSRKKSLWSLSISIAISWILSIYVYYIYSIANLPHFIFLDLWAYLCAMLITQALQIFVQWRDALVLPLCWLKNVENIGKSAGVHWVHPDAGETPPQRNVSPALVLTHKFLPSQSKPQHRLFPMLYLGLFHKSAFVLPSELRGQESNQHPALRS